MSRRFTASAMLIVSCCLVASAHATCTPPSQPGAIICYPSANSTAVFPVTFEAAATGQNNLPIVKMILYADNVKEHEVDNYNTFTWAWSWPGYSDPLENNGMHHLVLNAWDSEGHLFQYSEYINEIGGAIPQCAEPPSGFSLCSPLNGNYYPEDGVPIVTTGAANIVSYDVYFNGKYQFNYQGQNLDSISGLVPVTDKPIALTVVAYDKSNNKYTKSSNFYEYWASDNCGRSGCNPGIFDIVPNPYTDLDSGFTVSADVQYNTHTITAMKVYLDNTLVVSSSGPSIRGTVTANPGTHLLTYQAWDTTGALYTYQESVNVQ
jgi:hypothetical protein